MPSTTKKEYVLPTGQNYEIVDVDYIGTGGDAGKVLVRFYHTMAGNSAHDLDICCVKLFK